MTEVHICEVGSRRYRVRTLLSGGGSNDSVKRGVQNRPQGVTERRSLAVSRQLHKFVIGTGGSTLSKLREESNAKITVPNERSKSDGIEVEGLPDDVRKAEELINKIVSDHIHKVPYTHFISLPIADANVQRKVKEFQTDVAQGYLRDDSCQTFVEPASLHITIGMLRLLTLSEIAAAVDLLKSLEEQIYDILESRPLVASIGKVRAMEANAAKARVIYTQAEDFDGDGSNRLERMCRFVRKEFDKAGYIDEKRDLKIHITVLKAKSKTDQL
ncbi:activating signal cointegrator 1 complex subunit, partial [Coemansia erecta]